MYHHQTKSKPDPELDLQLKRKRIAEERRVEESRRLNSERNFDPRFGSPVFQPLKHKRRPFFSRQPIGFWLAIGIGGFLFGYRGFLKEVYAWTKPSPPTKLEKIVAREVFNEVMEEQSPNVFAMFGNKNYKEDAERNIDNYVKTIQENLKKNE